MTRPQTGRSPRPLRAVVLPGLVLALCLGLLQGPAPAEASGFLIPVGEGREHGRDWLIENYRVEAIVRGRQARVQVEQQFKNLGSGPLEADYLFPLPRGAVVSGLALFQGGEGPGGKGLEGQLFRAEQARALYEAVVRQRQDPALLQYFGQDIYRVRIFPIPAGGTARMVLSYDQTLPSDAGLVEFLHPLGSAQFSAAPVAKMTLRLDVEADAPLGPIYSPSHDVAVAWHSRNHAEISYAGPVPEDLPEIRVFWTTTSLRIGASLLTHWPKEESQGYFLFLAAPVQVEDQEEGQRERPKSITFVVDASGSMGGEKLEQVRAALEQVIPSLANTDHFNVIAYHNRVFALWDQPRAATPEAKERALLFVGALTAVGGTSIEGALLTALSAPAPEYMPSFVLFLTDGVPTIGEIDTGKILAMARRQCARNGRRVFVLGVGVDVNTVLLDRLALENGGVPAYVRPQESVELKLVRLYEQLRYPVLADVTFEARGMEAGDLLPRVMPNLFQGSEVLVAGRYGKGGPVELVLTGRDGELEREFHYTLAAARQGQGLTSDFPARVWATRRIGELLDAIRLQGRREPALVQEILRLSTKFGIITEYTSFLADETGVSHRALEVNARWTQRNIEVLTARVVGGTAVAQAVNNAARRDAMRAGSPSPGYYMPTESDRDLRRFVQGGVRALGNRTFYYRGRTIGWVDARVPSEEKPARVIQRWSPEFYRLLRTTTPSENKQLAQEGALLLDIQGQVVRIEDPK